MCACNPSSRAVKTGGSLGTVWSASPIGEDHRPVRYPALIIDRQCLRSDSHGCPLVPMHRHTCSHTVVLTHKHKNKLSKASQQVQNVKAVNSEISHLSQPREPQASLTQAPEPSTSPGTNCSIKVSWGAGVLPTPYVRGDINTQSRQERYEPVRKF